jgi:RNA polymerase primary sigma factor
MSTNNGASHLDNYLNEIGQIALLKREEEIELSNAIRRGKEPEAAQAEMKLIEANLRLVVSVAKRWQHTHLSMEELISAGNEGLQVAAKRFDPQKFHTRFSTYATPWIEQAIRMAANRAHTIRTPIKRAAQLQKVLNSFSYDESANQQNESKIATETGLKATDVRHVLKYRISEVISLDAAACDASDEPVSGVIPDERCQFQEMMDSEDLAAVRQAIAECLTAREQFVIRQRFGFDGDVATLDAVA